MQKNYSLYRSDPIKMKKIKPSTSILLTSGIALMLIPIIFLSCSSEPPKANNENVHVVASVKENESTKPDKKYVRFNHDRFSMSYPDDWIIDSIPNSPSLLSAHAGANKYSMVSLQAMILINDKHKSLEDFAKEIVNVKWKSSYKSEGLFMTIQEEPYKIEKAFKPLDGEKTIGTFYFYEIDKRMVLWLFFVGKLGAFTPEIDKEEENIVHSVFFNKSKKHK